MKVLFINNFFCNFSGIETCMYKEASLLSQNGHEVFFFATDKQPYLDGDYKYTNFFPKYRPYSDLSRFQVLKYLFKSFYNLEAEKKLDLLLQEIRPDIVHFHNIVYHLTPSVINACKKHKIPLVMTIHGPDLMCPSIKLMIGGKDYCKNEDCINGSPINCIANKCSDSSLTRSVFSVSEFMFRKIHKLYDKVSYIICPSQALFDLALRAGLKSEKLLLINNFTEDSSFDIQPEYNNKGYFLFIGRLSIEKGVHYLLEAMGKIPEHIKLHIVGTGPEETNLKDLSSKLNLSNVEFVGFKSGKELVKEYRDCIATILPCDWFDTFPTTILESFLYGKPVIASNVGGIPEMVENNKQGIIVEPGNVSGLSNAINKLYLDNNLAVKMGQDGRNKVKALYNSEIHYSKLIRVYESLINVY